jgi:hypothetical protein
VRGAPWAGGWGDGRRVAFVALGGFQSRLDERIGEEVGDLHFGGSFRIERFRFV